MNKNIKQLILPEGATKYLFFGGKGGVGKTTVATATAVWFADHGYRTTIVSTDPTVSLSAMFSQEIMEEKNTNSKTWLIAGLIVWTATVPLLSGAAESPAKAFGIILTWLLFPLAYAFLNKDFKGIGVTKDNIRNAIWGMLVVSTVYSVIRNFLIVYVPSSIKYIAASALTVAELLKQGYFGSIAGQFSKLFQIMFFITFLAAISNELFYRGFLFTRLKQFMDWKTAVLISALLFGVYHYLNVGLSGFIMGVVVSVVSGWLMQRYNNVAAPALFHFLQYIVTILVFYYFII